MSTSRPKEIRDDKINYLIDRDELVKGDILDFGAFATIYRAKWKNKDVVIKEIQFTKKFTFSNYENEIKMMRLCSHPNIIPFYGYNAELKNIIVMEYMNKGNRKWLN